MKTNTKGFSIIELLVAISIVALISVVVVSVLLNFRKNQALALDAQTVTSVLRQARNQTLSSQNASLYGVHFTSAAVILFTGSVYNAADATNQSFAINGADTILTISLAGGGSDVIFDKLTGKTSENGTITISSPGLAQTKTVTIYKTGLIDSQ